MKRNIKLFEFYNEVGRKYYGSDEHYKSGYAMARERFIKKILRARPKAFTLDVGCSDGHYRKYIKNYIGLDISLGYLKRFKTKSQRVWAVAEWIPFKDECFDRILLTEVLEHTWERKKILDGCYRILKSDGILILSTPYGKTPHCIRRSWKGALEKYKIRYCPYIHGHFSKEYTRKILAESNFHIRHLTIIKHNNKARFIVTTVDKGKCNG